MKYKKKIDYTFIQIVREEIWNVHLYLSDQIRHVFVFFCHKKKLAPTSPTFKLRIIEFW